jgi:(1->4)-alpha-D-glucan 1-alpha-D-glucosylmutase
MKAPGSTTPLATYRLQLTPSFGFADAAAVAPYVATLGVSHLYLSPIFAAAPGSEHGYDVLDHGRVNDELGGIAGLYELCRVTDQCGLGIIADIVPNHVGLAGGANGWWRDVMRYGRDSAFAPYFDIDWDGQAYLPAGLLVYPILGRPFGEALEAGELTLAVESGEIVVRYFEHSFPIAPRTYLQALGMPPPVLETRNPGALGELAELLDTMSRAGATETPTLLERFGTLLADEPAIAGLINDRLAECNGRVGAPASFDALERVLVAQSYRLASWRVSAEEVNYRRFFDINELAAIRIEHPPVFDAVHRLTEEFVAHGVIDGLRVDHIDGLSDPPAYLGALSEMLNRGRDAETPAERPLYVEKILGWDEMLPAAWQTTGTTGYDALAHFDRVFVDPAGEALLSSTYVEFSGRGQSFDEISFGTRRRTVERTFAGELNVLAAHLHRIAQADRLTRDITLRALHDAVAAFIASLPVYRTYLSGGAPSARDEAIVKEAAEAASERDPNVSADTLAFLCTILLSDPREESPEQREQRLEFRRRLQQLASPVMAKGVEDTAFYRYNRLLSLNEVGSNPAKFGASATELHEWFGRRAREWPRALSATTTHDTKRSEDARARLHVLSEIPREWRREVRAWSRMNSRYAAGNDHARIDKNLEYYYYQTLVASWNGPPTTQFRDRIAGHMTKAMREAKERTGWTRVNSRYEDAVQTFVRATLDGRRSRRFIERVQRFHDRIAPAAALNSLGLLTLKATAPGVPDFYQGSEGVLYSLTDPDNRRPVDFASLRKWAAEGRDQWAWDDSLAQRKLKLTPALLRLRGRHHELFTDAVYTPIEATGSMAEHVFGYVRRRRADWILIVVPRFTARMVTPQGWLPGIWSDTAITAPSQVRTWRNAITGCEIANAEHLLVSDILDAVPVGVYEGRTGR